METKEILYNLRRKYKLTQEEMADKLMVTRQAVSRWENGETVPNVDTLKIIATTFGITTDYLLGCDIPLNNFRVQNAVPNGGKSMKNTRLPKPVPICSSALIMKLLVCRLTSPAAQTITVLTNSRKN